MLQHAVEEWKAELVRPEKDRQSRREVALRHGVNPNTMHSHAIGNRTMSAFNASKQNLSPAEEHILVDMILGHADRGIPMANPEIVEQANQILTSRGGKEIVPTSSWISTFLCRHHNQLQPTWGSNLDSQRAKCLNPPAVEGWFALVKTHVADKAIRPEDTYGMDESGFPRGQTGKKRVVGQRGTKLQHVQGGADKENVTAIVTICMDGTVLKPTIIFKGQNMMKKWGEGNTAGASYVLSRSINSRANSWAVFVSPPMDGQIVSWPKNG